MKLKSIKIKITDALKKQRLILMTISHWWLVRMEQVRQQYWMQWLSQSVPFYWG